MQGRGAVAGRTDDDFSGCFVYLDGCGRTIRWRVARGLRVPGNGTSPSGPEIGAALAW